jgi:hypothetical protein
MAVSMFMLACFDDCRSFRLPLVPDDVCDCSLACECGEDFSTSSVLEPDVVEADEDGLGVLDCDDVPR